MADKITSISKKEALKPLLNSLGYKSNFDLKEEPFKSLTGNINVKLIDGKTYFLKSDVDELVSWLKTNGIFDVKKQLNDCSDFADLLQYVDLPLSSTGSTSATGVAENDWYMKVEATGGDILLYKRPNTSVYFLIYSRTPFQYGIGASKSDYPSNVNTSSNSIEYTYDNKTVYWTIGGDIGDNEISGSVNVLKGELPRGLGEKLAWLMLYNSAFNGAESIEGADVYDGEEDIGDVNNWGDSAETDDNGDTYYPLTLDSDISQDDAQSGDTSQETIDALFNTKYFITGTIIQSIANTIRAKTGQTGTIKPVNFATEIKKISVGSSCGSVQTVDTSSQTMYIISATILYQIANAIRSKKGTDQSIKPVDFASEIASI